LDDSYLKKLEEQKRLREEILRKKEERRKQSRQVDDKSDSASTVETHGLNRGVLPKNVKESPSKQTVYVNPKVIKGNLPSTAANVKMVGNSGDKKVNTGAIAKAKSQPLKPKTILRIIKNKKGEIISKSKVTWSFEVFFILYLTKWFFTAKIFAFVQNELIHVVAQIRSRIRFNFKIAVSLCAEHTALGLDTKVKNI